MDSTHILLKGKKNNFVTEFNPPIKLNKPSEICLTEINSYFNLNNIIKDVNDIFSIGYSNNLRFTSYFVIPPGKYSLNDINNELKKRFKLRTTKNRPLYDEKTDTYAVTIKGNRNTLKTEMFIKDDFYVNFSLFSRQSIKKILGFTKDYYYPGTHESENTVNILPVNSILINLDIVSGSYIKGVKANTIYSFFPNVNPGHRIIERPPFPIYLPLLSEEIHSIRVIITDQDRKEIDLKGEIDLHFHIRKIKQ